MTLDDFDRELRRHASRPPATAPHDAAQRVLARIARPMPRRGWLWLSATAALTALVLLVVRGRPVENPPVPEANVVTPTVVIAEPLPENVVLWWIDPETPVYFVVAPPTTHGGPS